MGMLRQFAHVARFPVQQLSENVAVTGNDVLQACLLQFGNNEGIADFPEPAGIVEDRLMSHGNIFSLMSNLCQEKKDHDL